MKIAKAIEIGATRTLLKTKIRPIKAKMTICPAVIFANKRTVKAKALAKKPKKLNYEHNWCNKRWNTMWDKPFIISN